MSYVNRKKAKPKDESFIWYYLGLTGEKKKIINEKI